MLFGILVYGIIFGVVTNIVIKNKGYEENWFWWGCLFGVFALIVACTKPSKVAVPMVEQAPAVATYIPQNISAEKCDTLFSIPERQYSKGSPVIIKAGKLLKERDTGKIFANFDFQIVTSKKLKGVFISVLEYDVAGDFLGKTDTQYLDLDRIAGAIFGSDKTIALSNHFTRKIEVQCTKVIFDDDTRWDAEGDWYQLPASASLSQNLVFELENQYRQEVNDKALFCPLELEELWICSCGFANNHSNSNCLHCRASKENVFASFNIEELRRKAEENRARELERQRDLEKQKKEEAEKAKERRKKLLKKAPKFAIAVLLIIIIKNAWTPKVELVAFNPVNHNDNVIYSSISKSDDYLHYCFKLKGLNIFKTYTLRHDTQWPGKQFKLSDWTWDDVTVGDILCCEWKKGYTASNTGTMVIHILDDETGKVLGEFKMKIE